MLKLLSSHFIKIEKVLFLLIFLLAAFLRIIELGNVPSGFYIDEASFAANAVSIMQTGRDEDGKFFPIMLESYIDPKPALFSYLQIPIFAVTGFSYASARLPSVVFGLATIVLFYFIVKKLAGKNLALISALLLAVSPWHIMASRATQEVIMSAAFALGALLTLLFLAEKRFSDTKLLALFAFLSFLGIYSYHSAKLFLPLVFFFTLAIYYQKKLLTKKKLILLSAGFSVILALSFIITGFTRFGSIGIFSTPETQLLINEKNTTFANVTNPLIVRIFNNKLVDYVYSIAGNYSEHFSPDFLLFKGGQPTRNIVPFSGLMYPIEIIFLVIGAAWAIVRSLKKYFIFVLMLIFAPIPAALTFSEVPSTIRTFPMVFPVVFFTALGIVTLLSLKSRFVKPASALLLLVFIYSVSLFLFNLFISQPNYHPWNRNFADNKLPEAVREKMGSYKDVFISSKPYDYFLLAGMITPRQMQESYPARLGRVFKIGKITFFAENCVFPLRENTVYFIANECNISRYSSALYGARQFDKITYKDGTTAYKIVELHKVNR